MTAEPDALRLVPVEPTRQMINAARVTFRNSSWHELSPSDIDRNVGTGAFREAWGAMLAASPAVQPAAGRSGDEPAAWAVAAERAASEEYAAYMGDPDGLNDTHAARNAAAKAIETHALAALATAQQGEAALPGPVTDEWAERFCEAVNWSPDGQECKTVEGEFRCVSFRDLAKGYILSAIATNPNEAHPPAQASESGGERDYPAEFEAWWATYKHRNRDVAEYPVKKQIAFDAFYFAALSAPQAAPGANLNWQSVAMWMGFSASVIKSGEGWSDQCQQHYDEARAAFSRLAAAGEGEGES